MITKVFKHVGQSMTAHQARVLLKSIATSPHEFHKAIGSIGGSVRSGFLRTILYPNGEIGLVRAR